MYLQHFDFKAYPFSIAPNPDVLYLSSEHKLALEALNYGIQRNGGFLLLTGQVGTGKTTVTRSMLQHLPDQVIIAYILNPRLNEFDLLTNISEELELDDGDEKPQTIRERISQINRALLKAHSLQKKVLLVIEEAQNLTYDVLEMLRLLTNLETNTNKLLTILLVGQPELNTLINHSNMEQFRQRIINHYHIQALNFSETCQYIKFRLFHAGGNEKVIGYRAMRVCYNLSQGIPRQINSILDNALLIASQQGKKKLGPKQVRQGHKKMALPPNIQTNHTNKLLSVTMIILFGLAIYIIIDDPKKRIEILVNKGIQQLYALQNNTDTMVGTSSMEVKRNDADVNGKIGEHENNGQERIGVPDNIVTVGAANSTVGQLQVKKQAILDKEVSLSALGYLLQLWNKAENNNYAEIENVLTYAEYCDTSKQLNCYQFSSIELSRVKQINLPGLASLSVDGVTNVITLASIKDSQIVIYVNGQEVTMEKDTFLQQWQGDFRLLWLPPQGYEKSLREGDSNHQLLNWAQQRLIDHSILSHRLITGGIYNQVMIDYVKTYQRDKELYEDGVLGIHTLLSLMSEQQRSRMPFLKEK